MFCVKAGFADLEKKLGSPLYAIHMTDSDVD